MMNTCNCYEDFDRSGNLLLKGKCKFWLELDDLIQKFDSDRIKLLPNPKNPPKKKCDGISTVTHFDHYSTSNTFHQGRRERNEDFH